MVWNWGDSKTRLAFHWGGVLSHGDGLHKKVKLELLETAATLGATRRQLIYTVVIPAFYLISSFQCARCCGNMDLFGDSRNRRLDYGHWSNDDAGQFLHTDEIMAGIMIIGALGLIFDLLFRSLHRKLFAYLY